MLKNFEEVERHLSESGATRRIALAGAQDDIALSAVVRAVRRGFVEPILVGDDAAIRRSLEHLGEKASDYRIEDAPSENRAARMAMGLVSSGEADFPMKGLMQTATFLMSVRFGGLVEKGSLINECTVFYYADADRLIVCGDCAVNIAPTLDEKKQITAHLIDVARSLGADPVLVAQLSVIEKPDPEIQSSVEARQLAEMSWGEDVKAAGPLALDNILDAESARHKGIEGPVAGNANVIVVPDIHAGNVLHKCVHFFGHYPFASMLLGAKTPIVMNSRTDDVDAKYYSILAASMLSLSAGEAS